MKGIHIFTILVLLDYALQHIADDSCPVQIHEDGVHVNCCYHQLTSVPGNLPQDVAWLDLSQNRLSRLRNLSFAHFSNLTHLDISFNNLQRLDRMCFEGLTQLKFLDLSNNQLQLDHVTYPAGVFTALTSLEELRLENNDQRSVGGYPDNVFNGLVSLQKLSIDTFSYVHFGKDFTELRNITTLDLGNKCKIRSLANDSLEGFKNSSLETLKITNCESLHDVDLCTFCDFPQLNFLHLEGNAFLSISSALLSLYGLQGQNLSLLNCNRVGHSLRDRKVVDRQNTRFLRNVCISEIKFSGSRIQRILRNALFSPVSRVVECVEKIDLTDNRITGDRSTFWKLFLQAKQLTDLQIQSQQSYSLETAVHTWGSSKKCDSDDGASTVMSYDFTFPLPKHLTNLNLSLNVLYIELPMPRELYFSTPNSLKQLDISYSGLQSCSGTFYGLNSLETMHITGNNCCNISDMLLVHVPNLRRLYMSNVNLNVKTFPARARLIFQHVHNLELLDLSHNNLLTVDPSMLHEKRHLKELNMAGNRLLSLSVDLDPHKDLELLDLSHNMLTTLLADERQALDSLASRHPIRLKLRGNPLLCACSNLDFLRWVWSTAVQLDGEGRGARNFTCTTEEGVVTNTARAMAEYDQHWRRCVGPRVFGITVAAFLLQILGIVIVYLVAGSWTHIKYALNVLRRLRLPKRDEFRKDAYVGYSDNDWRLACLVLFESLQERRGVRLLLRDQEELPGSVRAENIIEHIDESWKVLLLVTRDFAQDEWLCGFTVQQAQRSITDTMPDRVIVVFMEDPARLPPMASLERLLRMVPERNVLHVHRDTPPHHPAWDRVAEAIIGR